MALKDVITAAAVEAPKVAQQVTKAAPWTAGIIDRIAKPVLRVIGNFGDEGQTLSNVIRESIDSSERHFGGVMANALPYMKNLTHEEDASLAAALLNRNATLAQGNALPVYQEVERQLPLIEALKVGGRKGAAPLTPAAMIEDFKARGYSIPVPVTNKGSQLLPVYINEAKRQLSKSIIKRWDDPLAKAIEANYGKDAGHFARSAVDTILRPSHLEESFANLRALNTATLLGQAFALNMTQSAITGIVGGAKNLAKGVGALIRDPAEVHDFALRSGALSSQGVTDYIRFEMGQPKGAFGKVTSWAAEKTLQSTMFLKIERMNRLVAAAAGREFVKDIAAKAAQGNADAIKSLKRLNLDIPRITSGDLRPVDLERGAQAFTRLTQFRVSPEELPLDWSRNPFLRLATQFKGFGLKAAELAHDEMKQHPAKFILRTLALAPIPGEIGIDTRAIAKDPAGFAKDPWGFIARQGGKEVPGNIQRAFGDITAIGTLGLYADMIRAASYDSLASFAIGPTKRTVMDPITLGVNALQGRVPGAPFLDKKTQERMSRERFARHMTSLVPVVGPAIANMMPKRAPKSKGGIGAIR